MPYTVPVNRKRREVIGTAVADMAKFIATAGIIAVFVAGRLTTFTAFVLAAAALLFLVAYFIVPKIRRKRNDRGTIALLSTLVLGVVIFAVIFIIQDRKK